MMSVLNSFLFSLQVLFIKFHQILDLDDFSQPGDHWFGPNIGEQKLLRFSLLFSRAVAAQWDKITFLAIKNEEKKLSKKRET